eukprot:148810_1
MATLSLYLMSMNAMAIQYKNHITSPFTLYGTTNDHILSKHGYVRLIMQGDGNFVLNSRPNNETESWIYAGFDSGTFGMTNAHITLHNMGDLILYNTANSEVWNANPNSGIAPFHLVVYDESVAYILDSNNAILWTTHSSFNAPYPTFSASPTTTPTIYPTNLPTITPTNIPSKTPTQNPSNTPTIMPTYFPSKYPTNIPTISSFNPSYSPTIFPTLFPTTTPSNVPSNFPTQIPTKSINENEVGEYTTYVGDIINQQRTESEQNKSVYIWYIIAAIVVLLCFLSFYIGCIFIKKKQIKQKQIEQTQNNMELNHFETKTPHTNNFNSEIEMEVCDNHNGSVDTPTGNGIDVNDEFIVEGNDLQQNINEYRTPNGCNIAPDEFVIDDTIR